MTQTGLSRKKYGSLCRLSVEKFFIQTLSRIICSFIVVLFLISCRPSNYNLGVESKAGKYESVLIQSNGKVLLRKSYLESGSKAVVSFLEGPAPNTYSIKFVIDADEFYYQVEFDELSSQMKDKDDTLFFLLQGSSLVLELQTGNQIPPDREKLSPRIIKK